MEVHVGVLVGVDLEVGDGERVTALATRDLGGRRALAALGDATSNTFSLFTHHQYDAFFSLVRTQSRLTELLWPPLSWEQVKPENPKPS